MNILDDFEKPILPWYDRIAKKIKDIPLLHSLGGIFLSIYGCVGIMAHKSHKGLDIESFLFVPIGFSVLLLVLGGAVLYLFMILSYTIEKITKRPNIVGDIDLTNSTLIAAIATFLTISILAYLY